MKEKYSTFNILFITFISFISLFIFTVFEKYIPAKLSNDSNTIKEGMLFPGALGKSFLNTIHFFMYLGMNYNTPMIIVNLFSWIILVFALVSFLSSNKFINFSLCQMLFISFFSLMYWLYFSQYSKDIIVIIIFSLAIDISKKRKYLLINLIIAIGIYGYLFRSYWLIIFCIALFIPFMRISNKKKNILPLIYVFISFIIVIIIYYLFTHKQITNIRFTFYHPFAVSIIHNIIPNTSLISNIINYIYVLISLIIPVQGLPSINMVIYYLWVWCLFIFVLRNKKHIDLKLVFLFIIFINVQALFEPDFGSVFRHQIAWAPVLFYCFNPIKEYKFNK